LTDGFAHLVGSDHEREGERDTEEEESEGRKEREVDRTGRLVGGHKEACRLTEPVRLSTDTYQQS
jgi:hypothetical protein